MRPRFPEPRVFGNDDRPLFGWMHHPQPTGTSRGTGLVICKPFGYEAICSHRSLRHFAENAASLGFPVLRFDYDGTGDSAGDDRDSGRWRAWISSVHLAMDELRRAYALDAVYLMGVRLGATIAAYAAAERDDVAGLITIVPVLAGKSWLREANALEIAMRFPDAPAGRELPTGAQESVGFVLTDETIRTLRDIDLLRLDSPPARQILVIDRDDLPSPKWADRLSSLGTSVEHHRLPGFSAMMLDPHEAAVPEMMISVTTQWMDRHGATGTGRVPASTTGSSPVRLCVARRVVETATYFGREGNLFGVVSAPTNASPPRRAIVLLNAGAISHIGPSRLYVDLARRWAARGFLVLRFDQAGIADSPPFEGENENVVYAHDAMRGMREAVEFLRDNHGVHSVEALGLCSGAYHALKAAAAGMPLARVAIVNPLVFFWKEGMSLAYPPYQVAQATARYKQAVLHLHKWKKLLAGKVDLRDIVQVGARRVSSSLAGLVRNLTRSIGVPLPQDLGAELQSVANRGVAMRFVFARGDPGEDLLRAQAGWTLPRLVRDRRLTIRHIDGPNHAFTPVWSRAILAEVLEAELDVRESVLD